MKIIIAGGGIGGLVTAMRLHQAGFEVKVFESVEEVKPLGVGINLLPHAVRVLTNIGLLPKVSAIAVETKELIYANRFGQFFWSEPRGKFAGYRWPQFSIHRGKFQVMLWEETLKTIDAENLKANCHLHSFEEKGNKITATFINKETGQIVAEEEGDILIGADGINSVLRQKLYPNEGGVVFSGNILYRGTALMKPYKTGSSMAMIGSMKQKMVIYPIGEPDAEGNQVINWVANVREPEGANITVRDWNRKVEKGPLLALYRDWKFDWINVPEMIEKTDGGIFEFPMSDRNPLDKWSFGRVTLLGDAAHPMYPIGSNGASQAILDADALALALLAEKDVIQALVNYDKERVPATAKVVLQNRQKGPDFIMDLMEERFPAGFSESEIPHEELAQIMNQYKQVAGFDIQSLNAKT
ncbi:flavin-dependent oxidoreductase [Aquirufa lenticrescens]|uniref:flavin-dependent oxidoreductase n=1 Tax=Aquirufa lenticrescens TaxID=2696560 RepID=UPI001CAA41A7|nr:flavin-dependent oxidoreductase [Aquirufa lenticrescens]UAJ14151.1 flavin-dependent oxidoreductase [Aquirufa lenticrescens]